MKTEFNVERVCERVHMCVVEAPDELGPAHIEIRNGSLHVSFPNRIFRLTPSDRSGLDQLVNSTSAETEKYWDTEVPNVPDSGLAESNAQNAPEGGAIAKPKRRGK